ncbi:MAG: RNA-binding protein [Verrucomicrobiaceae bacterium]
MNTKMYVGNLPFAAQESDIRELFSQYGTVTDIFLPMDRESGRPRGFAFVTMDTPEAMQAAISNLNGQEFQGRKLGINEARPREERPGGFGGGGGRGGYGGGGGGRGGYGGGGRGGDRGDRGGYGGGGGGGGGKRFERRERGGQREGGGEEEGGW